MKRIPLIISLVIMAFMVTACTEESTTERETETIDKMFQSLKASYKGAYVSTNNITQLINFTIDEQANVVVDGFPLDLVFARLYPSGYSSISGPVKPAELKAPIKGFNINSPYIEFGTDIDNTAPIEFTFVKDDEEHKGWAMVYAAGLYNPFTDTLTIQFSVVDLVVDGQDMRSITPVVYFIDSAVKESSN